MITNVRTWVEINRTALKHNCQEIRRLLKPGCRLMAVVKSNAYGHGLVDFSRLAEKFGVAWFGVDSIVEAQRLRKAGIRKPILVLGYTLQKNLAVAFKHAIAITVADLQALQNLRQPRGTKRKLHIHLKIDTGMHRQGLMMAEIPKAIRILESKRSFVQVEGIYTHFSSAKDPNTRATTKHQVHEFNTATSLFALAGYTKLLKHAAATSGTMAFPESHYDMVRIGIGLFGLWPSKEIAEAFQQTIHLRPVLTWKTIVAQLKQLPKGARIGYDLTETLTRRSIVALLPVGYWHGFSRSLSSVGSVLVNGKRAKVLGRVSMDMISVDVTACPNVTVGTVVVLLGQSGSMRMTADELAQQSGTTNYEFITRLNPLMKKVITS